MIDDEGELLAYLSERHALRPKWACRACWDVGRLRRATLIAVYNEHVQEHHKALSCLPCFQMYQNLGWARVIATRVL